MKSKGNHIISIVELAVTLGEALNGDISGICEIVKTVEELPANFRDKIFIYNLQKFLYGLDEKGTCGRKIGEILAKSDYGEEYGITLLKLIDSMDMGEKAKYLSYLCDSTAKGFVSSDDCFMYGRLLRDLTPGSIRFIKNSIGNKEFSNKTNEITELLSYDLMYGTDNGYAFSEKAYLLDKYAISYCDEEKYKYNGEKDIIPDDDKYPKASTFLLV